MQLFGGSVLESNLVRGNRINSDALKVFRKKITDWKIQEDKKPNKDRRKLLSYKIELLII